MTLRESTINRIETLRMAVEQADESKLQEVNNLLSELFNNIWNIK